LLTGPVRRGNATARLQLASVYSKSAQVHRAQGDIRSALESYAQSRAICERLLQESPSDRELLNLAGALFSEMTLARFELGDIHEAGELADSAMDMARRLLALDPGNRIHRQGLATANVGLGTVRLAAGQLEMAAASYRAAIEVREQLVSEDPDNVSCRRDLMVGYGSLGDVLGSRTSGNLGDTAGAAAAFGKALEIAQWLRERDPADRKAKFDVVSASLRVGALAVDNPREAAAGLRHLEEAESILKQLMAEDPKNSRYRYHAAYVDRKMGEAFLTLNRNREAARRLEQAASMSADLVHGPDGPNARIQMTLAKARLAAIEAAAGNARAQGLAEAVVSEIAKPPSMFTSAWIEAPVSRDLGRAYRGMGRMPEAIAWLEKSRQRLWDLKAPAGLETKRQTELAAVEADLAACRGKSLKTIGGLRGSR
jgi:tetratricopeptide (TPR) repeat protein